MNKKRTARCFAGLLFILLLSSFILGLPGCTIFGVLAGKLAPPPTIPAMYTGMANQSIAIMVWAGDGTLIDFPDVRVDLAGSLQNKLAQAQQAKTKELTGIKFATTPAAIVRFQENHPEYEGVPVTEVAPKFGASRVIYIEIENLQTRSDIAVELYRGSALATLKVIEVPPDGGTGKVAYEESAIASIFPPHSREEGSPNGNDFKIYRGTVDALTTELAKRFFSHLEEE